MPIQEDKKWLSEAVRLAREHAHRIQHGAPCGVVIVREGVVVGRGVYAADGGQHAEIRALAQAGTKARGATLYSALEPCTWFPGKRTGSCCHALTHAGVGRVVFGVVDPHPRVRGKEALLAAGVPTSHVPHPGAAALLKPYLARAKERFQNRRPYVIVKTAMSLDGKIANPDRSALLLSSAEDQAAVEVLRASCDGILVGGYTAIHDDPRLIIHSGRLQAERVRAGRPSQPAKIAIVDRELPSLRSRFMAMGSGERIIFTTFPQKAAMLGALQQRASVYATPGTHVDIKEMLRVLGSQHGIRRLLVEGGGETNAAFFAAGCVDELRVSIAPVVVGGKGTPTLVDGSGLPPAKRPVLKLVKQERLGENTILSYAVTF